MKMGGTDVQGGVVLCIYHRRMAASIKRNASGEAGSGCLWPSRWWYRRGRGILGCVPVFSMACRGALVVTCGPGERNTRQGTFNDWRGGDGTADRADGD